MFTLSVAYADGREQDYMVPAEDLITWILGHSISLAELTPCGRIRVVLASSPWETMRREAKVGFLRSLGFTG